MLHIVIPLNHRLVVVKNISAWAILKVLVVMFALQFGTL